MAEAARSRRAAVRALIVSLLGGISLLNDSYNANPGSMAAALRTVSQGGSFPQVEGVKLLTFWKPPKQ